MPIVGSLDLSLWSHSTVFTVSQSTFSVDNAPPLMSRWIQPAFCRDRWMLIDNGRYMASAYGFTTFTYTPGAGSWSIEVSPIPSPQQNALVMITKKDVIATLGEFDFTVWSIAKDPLFTSCQPYRDQPLYSPGVCPQGQEVVEITEVHVTQSNGAVQTAWSASCCSSGMTFGSAAPYLCLSTIKEPISAHALLTTSFETLNETFAARVYEWQTTVDGSTSTVSNMTLLKTGLAVAEPVVVAWQLEDMVSFPSDYRTSLAQKIGVALSSSAPSASPAGTTTLPSQTGDATPASTPHHQLAPGSIAGIVIGALVGTALLVGIVVGLLWQRKKRLQSTTPAETDPMPEMEDQDIAHALRRWFVGGRWRSEVHTQSAPSQELDSKTVRVVPGPPAELDTSETGVRHE